MSTKILFDRITIIGLGLIGSSIARAAHEKNLAKTIVGCDANEVSLAYARKHKFIDAAAEPREAVAKSNLVILATPPSTLSDIMQLIAPALEPGAIVMDVCSVKQPAIAAITPHLPDGVHFMPAHPIAGSEQSGVAAGRADLFERKRVIITPDQPQEDSVVLQAVTAFWKELGARVEGMPPHLHDLIYAYVSHLPQLLAFAASAPLDGHEADKDDHALTKFLRLQRSSPDMWADIFLLNKENVLAALDRYLDAIVHIESELAKAPDETTDDEDEKLARTALFPRIAASCLITTVMEVEKKAGFSFARYAGTGFADFTYAASLPPDDDIERISGEYKAVKAVLGEYRKKLGSLRILIAAGDSKKLVKSL